MEEYTVRVSDTGDRFWYKPGTYRLDGPAEFNHKINPVKELTVSELEKMLGYTIKIVK